MPDAMDVTGQQALEAAIDAVLAQEAATLPKKDRASSNAAIDVLAEQWHSKLQSVAVTNSIETDVLPSDRDRPSHLAVLARVFSALAAISCVSLIVALSVPQRTPADQHSNLPAVATIASGPEVLAAEAPISQPVKARKLVAKRLPSKTAHTASKSRRR